MSFRDQILTDLDTFINTGEWGESIEIDGVALPAVVERRLGPVFDDPGVNLSELEITVKESDLARPKADQEMNVNGEYYQVRSVEVEDGMLAIIVFKYAT